MTRTATLVGYALIAVALLAYQLAGLRWRRTPTIGEALAHLTRRRPARCALLAGWLWLGWHVFVRAGVR